MKIEALTPPYIPLLLVKDRLPVATESTTSSTPSSVDSAVFQIILPVKVRQKDSNVCVNTYCFYDNGSTGCFISEKLYDQLQVCGAPTRPLMKTMNVCRRSDVTFVRERPRLVSGTNIQGVFQVGQIPKKCPNR